MTRQRLAYTTDLTDEEWQMLAPRLPPEKAGVDPANTPCERCSMASSMGYEPAVPGA